MIQPKSGIVCGAIGLTVLGSLSGSVYECPPEPPNQTEVRCVDPGQGSTGKMDGVLFPNQENRASATTTFSTT